MAKYSYEFAITNHVQGEITDYYPEQQIQLQRTIHQNKFIEKEVAAPEELEIFGKLMGTGRLGSGESSAIACAIFGNHKLAIDDKRAIKEAKLVKPNLEIMTTQDLMVSMIMEQLLDVSEADKIKTTWESHHRFRLKFKSFKDILP